MDIRALLQEEKCFFVLFGILILCFLKSSSSTEFCPLTEIWPETPLNTCTVSTNLCINDKKELSQRCCNAEGTWKEAPKCTNYQNTMSEIDPCPQEFKNTLDFCYSVIENTTYPPKCPNPHVLNFVKYIQNIDKKWFPVWMPVERDRSYGIGLFHWTEKGPNYKTTFKLCTDNCRFTINSFQDNCVIYHNASFVETSSCNATHNAVCAYNYIGSNGRKTFCSQQYNNCVQSDYFSPLNCLCINENNHIKSELVYFRESYQNLAYDALTTRSCYIGLENDNGYVWSDAKEINYTNWSPKAKFGEDYKFGALSPDGWILTKTNSELNCSLTRKSISAKIKSSLINIEFDKGTCTFNVKVKHPSNWLQEETSNFPEIFCFSDASIDTIYERLNITKNDFGEDIATFSFKPLLIKSGHYWCEGFIYPKLEVITSKKYLLRSHEEEYVLFVSKSYDNSTNPLTEDNLKSLQNSLQNEYKNTKATSFVPRIFGVIRISEQNATLLLNFHLSNTANDTKMNYAIVQNISSNALTDFQYEAFLSADSCIGFQLRIGNKAITWQTTNIGETLENAREGFCINSNGAILHMGCGGNFVTGGEWSFQIENCADIVKHTNATVNLTSIIAIENPVPHIASVIDIINRHPLGSTDIHLITQFIEQLTDHELSKTQWVTIFDNLMDISTDILKSSQIEYGALERILDCLELLIEKHEAVKINKPNIIILSEIPTANLSYITWNTFESNTELKVRYDRDKELKSAEGSYSVKISFHDIKLLGPHITIFAFNKPTFFNCDGYFKKFTEPIIQILNTNFFSNSYDQFINVEYKTTSEIAHTCFVPSFGPISEDIFWRTVNQTTKNNYSKVICEFPLGKHFGLMQNVNVTKELDQITSENSSLKEKLDKVKDLINNFLSLFQAIDVFYITEVIKLVVEEKASRDMFTTFHIINEIMNITPYILRMAETIYRSGSTILRYLGSLVPSLENSSEISLQNVYLRQMAYGNNIDVHSCNRTTCEVNITNKECVGSDICIMWSDEQTSKIPVNVIVLLRNSFVSLQTTSQFSSRFVGLFHVNKSSANMIVHFLQNTGEHNADDYNCAHNNVVEGNANWYEFKASHNNSVFSCIVQSGFIGISHSTINVTSILESILNSTDSIEIRLKQTLETINNFTENFREFDVFLVSAILSKVAMMDDRHNEIILLCTRILDAAMNINSHVIQRAQREFEAADDLMMAFWEINNKLTTNQSFQGSNLLFLSYVINSQFRGIEIANCKKTCNVTILEETNELSENDYNSVEIKFILSENLVDEILNTRKNNTDVIIFFSVFFNNVLFDRIALTTISNVYGIQVPNTQYSLKNRLRVFVNTTSLGREEDVVHCGSLNTIELEWTFNGHFRRKDGTCFFFQQGFYAVVNYSDFHADIDSELTHLTDSNPSFTEILYRLEFLTFYYNEFTKANLNTLSSILQKYSDIDEEDLSSMCNIINNILKMKVTLLRSAQIESNCINKILKVLYTLPETLSGNYSYTEGQNFHLLVCDLNVSNSVTISKNSAFCNDRIFSKLQDENMILVTFQPPIGSYNRREPSKFVLTVFRRNSFFAENDNETSSVIGFSTKPYISFIQNNIYVSFQTSHKQNLYHCGYWNFMTNEHSYSLWWMKPTNYTDNWIVCKYPLSPYPTHYSLFTDRLNYTINLAQVLKGIRDYTTDIPQKLENTQNLLEKYINLFEEYHISLVSQILNNVNIINRGGLEYFCYIINHLMNISRKILIRAQQNYNATDHILHSLERIAKKYHYDSYNLALANFAIIITNEVAAVVVEDLVENITIRTINNITMEDFENHEEMITGIYLDENLQKQLRLNLAKLIVTFFFKDDLFNDELSNFSRIPGNIVGIALTDNNVQPEGSFWLYDNTNFNKNEKCAFWNYSVVNEAEIQRGFWEVEGPAAGSRCECRSTSYIALLEDENLNITNTLENILQSTASAETKLKRVDNIVSGNSSKLTPIDIHLISQILDGVRTHPTTMKHMILVTQIVSGLLQVDRQILRESQVQYNATDRILHNLDQMSSTLHNKKTEVIVQNYITMALFNLKDTNINGVKLSNCSSRTCNIIGLQNITLNKLAFLDGMETGIVLSDSLMTQIQNNHGAVKLVVTIFFHDALFNDEKGNMSTSMIFGILLTGLVKDMEGDVYTMYNKKTLSSFQLKSCAYWEYKMSNHSPIRGYWKDEAVPKHKNFTAICQFGHLTHFALLLASGRIDLNDALQDHILDIITKVNCFLSLFGIIGIILTAFLFEKWRKNTGNQILINFSIAISIKILMLYISELVDRKTHVKVLCYISGAVLHYSVLSEFCWMLIIAILQFKRFVEVLGGPPKYVILKSCICGWLLPTFPVFCILILDIDNYLQSSLGICYPSGIGLHLGVWLPLIIIITTNFIIFIFIIYNVFHKKTEFKEQINYEILFQWRLAILLFSMLGLTWFFGFISLIKGSLVFIYLFCFTASLQGFIMFLFFIVFNKSTRFLYKQSLKSWMYINGYKYH